MKSSLVGTAIINSIGSMYKDRSNDKTNYEDISTRIYSRPSTI